MHEESLFSVLNSFDEPESRDMSNQSLKIVILAAGKGSRLGDLTREIPKNLVEVSGRPIIDYQLDALRSSGISDDRIIVITGHANEAIRQALPLHIECFFNEYYAMYNNIYSVAIACDRVNDDMLLINGDTLFAPAILRPLLDVDQDATLVIDDQKSLGHEEMKTVYEGGRLVTIGKDLKPDICTGEYIGLLRFRSESLRKYRAAIQQMMNNDGMQSWYEDALNLIADEINISMVATDGQPWIEIDTLNELEEANRMAHESHFAT